MSGSKHLQGARLSCKSHWLGPINSVTGAVAGRSDRRSFEISITRCSSRRSSGSAMVFSSAGRDRIRTLATLPENGLDSAPPSRGPEFRHPSATERAPERRVYAGHVVLLCSRLVTAAICRMRALRVTRRGVVASPDD